MKISFSDGKLEKRLSDGRTIQKDYGKKLANKIMLRIKELEAAPTLKHIPNVPPPRLHELQGNYEGCFAVSVGDVYRIIFRPVGCTKPYDKGLISEIEIISIVDYH